MIRLIVSATVICLLASAAIRADEQRDLAADVLAVFSAKCAVCHGPDVKKPKGRFGYVTDLARVAGNREMVIPGAPDESELWELVRRGEMPPEDSSAGPLSAYQKETVRAWIAAGAPVGESSAAGGPPSPTVEEPLHRPSRSDASSITLVLEWLSRFHILIIHFPIALLLSAVFCELGATIQGRRAPSPVVRFCVLFGAASAVAAATLGWLYAGNGHGAGMPYVLRLHRWLGTTTALWSLGTAAFSEWEERRRERSWGFRAALVLGALLVAGTGHLGGTLIHGEDFLTGG